MDANPVRQHDHDDRNAWFLDQLCTIAVCAGYAVVVTAMFVGKYFGSEERSLINVIVPWMQHLLLIGIAILAVLTAVRGFAVWGAARRPVLVERHCEHDASDGHSHGWSPWKYIPLLIPLVFFLGLGLPDERMLVAFERELANETLAKLGNVPTAASGEAVAHVQLTAVQVALLDQTGGLATAHFLAALTPKAAALDVEARRDGYPAASPTLGEIELIASDSLMRTSYAEMWRIETEGTFHAGRPDGSQFRVVRMRMPCCLNDASPVILFCSSSEPNDIKDGAWVAVQGRLDFIAHDGKWLPVMRVHKVGKKKPPHNPALR